MQELSYLDNIILVSTWYRMVLTIFITLQASLNTYLTFFLKCMVNEHVLVNFSITK